MSIDVAGGMEGSEGDAGDATFTAIARDMIDETVFSLPGGISETVLPVRCLV